MARQTVIGPVLVIHGGTGRRPDGKRLARLRRSLRAVAEEAYAHLRAHSALESVVFAVQRLEDDPLFNAGTGSVLQRDGTVRMSASVMDGARQRFAAVLNIERVRYPIAVAHALLDEDDRVLAGTGATRFARSHGIPPWDPVTALRRRQWERRLRDPSSRGTVGAVALDRAGRLAAATSTGGKGCERVGRVSDSGLPAGNYANRQAAISCTGLGEDIMDEGLAVRIAQQVSDGSSLARACTRTFRELSARRRYAGAIALDQRGRWVWATTLPTIFAVAQTAARRVESF